MKKEPKILLWSVATFLLLSCTGLYIVSNISQGMIDYKMTEATELAKSSVEAFSESLDLAILPLFSLSQFVFEIDELRALADEIGQVGVDGSLPLLPNPDGHPTHRNITGVCDSPRLQQRFSDIAGIIKQNAKMDGVLVNIQLAPMATVCLVHPINNTEDFPEGVYLDSSGAIGHDLLSDPRRKFIAEATLPANRVVTAGPLSLVQCKDCSPVVERAFIARLPIYMDEYSISLDNGSMYNAWGFAVALINWQELIDRSNIVEMFQALEMAFELTRTDMTYDPIADVYEEKIVQLASLNAELLTDEFSVKVDLETTDNHVRVVATRVYILGVLTTFCSASGKCK